jgi:hypothetical protein
MHFTDRSLGETRTTRVSGVAIALILLLALRASAQDTIGTTQASCEPDVGLNHFYVVLDEETFSAVLASPFFFTDFASVDAGLPIFAAPDSTSERLFVRGRNTYLELFRQDNRFGEPVGKVGIGLGVDRADDLDCAERLWSERLEGPVQRSRIERQTEDAPVPWYDAIERSATNSNPDLVLWATAYRPEFLRWLYPDRPTGESGVARADFLAPRFDPRRLLEDVTELVGAVPAELRLQIASQLEAIGYDRREDGDLVTLTGGDWSLALAETDEGRGELLAVHFSTTREKPGLNVVRLGPRSLLVFGPGHRAAWYFLSSSLASAS